MYTLIVDDRELIVKLMLNIMGRLDPGGTHLGANNPDDALRLAKGIYFTVPARISSRYVL